MKPDGKPVLLSEMQAGTAKLLNDYQVDIEAMDDDAVAEIFILNQVTEWAFGNISHETIGNVPSSKIQMLVKELNELYKPSPLAVTNSGNSPKTPSLP